MTSILKGGLLPRRQFLLQGGAALTTLAPSHSTLPIIHAEMISLYSQHGLQVEIASFRPESVMAHTFS